MFSFTDYLMSYLKLETYWDNLCWSYYGIFTPWNTTLDFRELQVKAWL